MKELILKLKEAPETGLEVETVLPEIFAGKSLGEVSNLPVFLGNRKRRVSDFFDIAGEIAKNTLDQRIVLEGNLSRVKRIGENMNGGEILINGSIGIHLGEFMQSGKITVMGNANSWIGTSMAGGEILIEGNAQDYIGCAKRGENKGMKGGRIIINGNTGTEIGSYLVEGEIMIKGMAESFVGSYAKGGKITIEKISKNRIGYLMKTGEIFVLDPDFKVPFYFNHLMDNAEYSVYQGDLGIDGKGLVYVARKG